MLGAYFCRYCNAYTWSEHRKWIAAFRYSSLLDELRYKTVSYNKPRIKITYNILFQCFDLRNLWIFPIYSRNIINILVHGVHIISSYWIVVKRWINLIINIFVNKLLHSSIFRHLSEKGGIPEYWNSIFMRRDIHMSKSFLYISFLHMVLVSILVCILVIVFSVMPFKCSTP